MNTGWAGVAVARLLPIYPHVGQAESTGSRLSAAVVHADAYSMKLSPDYFPDELRMDWRQVRDLRRDIAQEAGTYRIIRLVQPEGSHYWEVEVAYRPTGELFCLRWRAEWADRLRRDAGY